MTEQFEFQIPLTDASELTFTLRPGDVLYMLGANGTGKSALVTRLFSAHRAKAKRISAHRQTWFRSNTLNMTPRNREQLEGNIQSQDAQAQARYRLEYADQRADVAIYDLIDADTMLARKIAELVRAGNMTEAQSEAQIPAPIAVINELMRLSNIPIEISVEERQRVVAKKQGGPSYSVAELSDGERNAFLLAADVLTAKPAALIIIDEPERHLHRSIVSPLLRMLFDRRKDCTFILSTHELMLPVDTPQASTLLLRGCEFADNNVKAWQADLVGPGVSIDDELKKDVLGARRKIIFVEGKAQSLDAPLYSLLFPYVSVIPKENCRAVEHAVRGLRSAEEMHWVTAWGIVDNDQRTPEDIERLHDEGIWALSHYAVESLYYHPKVIQRITERQTALIGGDAASLMTKALTDGVASVSAQAEHLISGAVLRAARDKFLSILPTKDDIGRGTPIKVEVDVAALLAEEKARFDTLIAAQDWDGLLTRYPVHQSSALDRIAKAIKLADRATYQEAVLRAESHQSASYPAASK